MSDWIDSQGYRANVGIVLMRDSGEVFLGQRTGARGWQFPQGGVRQGEAVEHALFRELEEEIGLQPQHVKLMGSTSDWIRYRLPKRYVRRGRGPTCIGQKQRWFLLRLAFGTAAHRVVAPAAALAGGTLLAAADLVARTAAAPRQLPVGAIMALLGVPMFLVLLRRLEGPRAG